MSTFVPEASPRDHLTKLPQIRRGRRCHVTTPLLEEGDTGFIALGTWTHPRSREFDLAPVNAHYNWRAKIPRFGTVQWR